MANAITEWMAEAQRRRVFRTVGVYIVAVWGISSGGVDIASVLGIPESALRTGIFVAVGLIPIVAILAWRFDIGREGIVRDPQDVVAQQQAEAELAAMPTMIGADEGAGAIVVRWEDAGGESSALFMDEFHLGRGTDCRVRFYDPLVSRRHARIFREDEVWYIEDLGSRNGTRVDGARVDRAPLPPSSEIRLNDAGPCLRVDLVEPGAETRNALSQFPPGQPTAHVRLATPTTKTANRSPGAR